MPLLTSSNAVQRQLTYVIAVGVIVGLGLYLRWPAMQVNSFRNEDVAGITYNADLLRRHMVPLVDDLEYKAPGAFFLSWAVWQVGGRSVRSLERFGIAWAILAALGVFVGGVLLFGTASGLLAALLYTLASPITDGVTVNYNTWMITAYIWATVLFIAALRRGGWAWFVSSGVVMTFAALLKRQGGVLMPLFVLCIVLAPYLPRPAGWAPVRRRSALLAYGAGLVLGMVPIALYYLIASGLSGVGTLIRQFFFSKSGWRYVGGEIDWDGKIMRLKDGALGFWKFMALSTLLASMTIAGAALRRYRVWTLRGVLLGGHALFSIFALSLGFRFYAGYYVQALPAVVWLAAHPEGPLLRWFDRRLWPVQHADQLGRICMVLCTLLACAPALLNDLDELEKVYTRRTTFSSPQRQAEAIARLIKRNSKPHDRIWVWGRWAWPVYFHADRISCTRYYKVLGVITTNLDNTWRRPTRMTRFNFTGPWRQIGQQLATCKPLYIVTAVNEAYDGFAPLERLLAEHYQKVPPIPGVRAFSVYRRRERRTKLFDGRAAPPALIPSRPR